MQNKKIFSVLVFIMLLLTSTAVYAKTILKNNSNFIESLESSTNAKWTVMMYLAFDNHRYFEEEITFNMLKEIGSNSDFNIVGLYDGLENDDTNYFCVKENLVVPLSWYESESDMGHVDTLKNFIKLTKYYYPADNYALFVCSTHGSGWQGLGVDTFGTGTFKKLTLLTMGDYTEALKDATFNGTDKIDVIGFDICVTASIEAAYQISPYADYMIGTEEHGFGPNEFSDNGTSLGWNFSYFLQNLKNNPDMNPEDFSKSVVNSYIPGTYTAKIANKITAPKFYPINIYNTTISASNLTKISSLIQAVKNLANNLSNNITSCKKEIKQAREETREYGKLYRKYWFLSSRTNFLLQLDPFGYDCFIDLYDFVYNLKKNSPVAEIANACDVVMQEINKTVIANNVVLQDHSYGLFIYFPQQKCQYDQSIWRVIGSSQFRKIPESYNVLDFSKDTNWDDFIKVYLNI